jgi:phosphoglucomutase/phosphomannomutase
VPGHVANPENAAVFDEIVAEARQVGANVVLATDPDCDRMGAAAPLTPATDGPWRVLDGNQLGALLADYVLEQLAARKRLTPQHYVVTTLVTTLMICRIARSYGVQCCNDNLVGFKWIGDVIDQRGPDQFVFGAEESHGYLVGTYARDKDGAVAAMLMAELAARCHHQGFTLHQRLDQLYRQHGYHAERLVTVSLPGSDGMRRAHALMTAVRGDGLTTLGGWPIVARRDYLSGQRRLANGVSQPLVGPTGDLVILDLEADGNYVAVRPSGTEPKIKMYLFGYVPPQALGDLAQARQETSKRLDQMVRDVKELTNRIA